MDVEALGELLRETEEHPRLFRGRRTRARLVGLVRGLHERSRAREDYGGGRRSRRVLHGGGQARLRDTRVNPQPAMLAMVWDWCVAAPPITAYPLSRRCRRLANRLASAMRRLCGSRVGACRQHRDYSPLPIGGSMTSATIRVPTHRAPALLGQTVVVIGGSAGIGFETARHARTEGAEIILTARDPERLKQAAHDLGAVSGAAFDASDPDSLAGFFDSLSGLIDHVMVGGAGPQYGRPLEMDPEEVRRAFSGRAALVLEVARNVVGKVRPGGSVVLIGGTGGRRITPGYGVVAAVTASLPALTASLALDLAPIRVNLIAPGFVDTPLSATLLGDGLEARRAELRAKLPIGRVVEPADVAALAVHLMINTAVTGATYDIDGGQQFIA